MGQPLKHQLDHLHRGFQLLFDGEPVLWGVWECGGHIAIADAFNGQIYYSCSQIVLRDSDLHDRGTAEELKQQIQHLSRWLDSASADQLSRLAHWAAACPSELILVLRSKSKLCSAHCRLVGIASYVSSALYCMLT